MTHRFSLPPAPPDPGPPIQFEIEVPGPVGEESTIEQFSIPRRARGALILDLTAAQTVPEENWRVEAAFASLTMDLLGAEYPRFIAVTNAAGWSGEDVRDAVFWMVRESAQRPTTPSAEPATSQPDAGTSSTDGSSSNPVDA